MAVWYAGAYAPAYQTVLNSWNPLGPSGPVMELLYLLPSNASNFNVYYLVTYVWQH